MKDEKKDDIRVFKKRKKDGRKGKKYYREESFDEKKGFKGNKREVTKWWLRIVIVRWSFQKIMKIQDGKKNQ